MSDVSNTLPQQPWEPFDSWLTKQQAATYIGVSEKTLDRLAAAGEIQKTTRKTPGKPSVCVFHPGDLERARAARSHQPDAFVIPSNAGIGPVSEESNSKDVGQLRQQSDMIAERLVTMMAAPKGPVVSELRHKVYLTTPEAELYTGLPAKMLAEMSRSGKIRCLKELRPFRYRRADLDGL